MAEQTYVFKVGMTCGGCEKAVRAIASKTPGVTAVDVDLAAKKVTVRGTVDKATLTARLQKTGKSVEDWAGA